MLAEANKIVRFHVLGELTDKIFDLILGYDEFNDNISNSTSTSKNLVANCAIGLSKEMHKISEVETKLMEKFKLVEAARSCMNFEEGVTITDEFLLKIFLEHKLSMHETHEYLRELFNCLKRFNNILMPFGRLICECMTCYDFKKQQMTRKTTSTMQIDDFENIQKDLRHANLIFDELILVLQLKFVDEMSTDSMTDMAAGFELSRIAYKSIWRGMIMFNEKITEARHHGDKREGKYFNRRLTRKENKEKEAILRKLTQMG